MNPDIRYFIQKNNQILQTPCNAIGSATTGVLKNRPLRLGFFNDVWVSGPMDSTTAGSIQKTAKLVKTLYVWSVISHQMSDFTCISDTDVDNTRAGLMREITDALSHTDTIGYLFSSSGLLPLEKERFRIYKPEDSVRIKCVIEPMPWSRSADFFLTNIKRGPTKELLNALFMECATNEELLMRLRRIDRRMVHADWDPNGRIWVPYKLSLAEVPELVDGKIRTTFKHIDDNQFQQIRPLLLNVAEKALTDFYKDTTK